MNPVTKVRTVPKQGTIKLRSCKPAEHHKEGGLGKQTPNIVLNMQKTTGAGSTKRNPDGPTCYFNGFSWKQRYSNTLGVQ